MCLYSYGSSFSNSMNQKKAKGERYALNLFSYVTGEHRPVSVSLLWYLFLRRKFEFWKLNKINNFWWMCSFCLRYCLQCSELQGECYNLFLPSSSRGVAMTNEEKATRNCVDISVWQRSSKTHLGPWSLFGSFLVALPWGYVRSALDDKTCYAGGNY